ncbi:unnamed protein product [Pedinophyceae sp. YPF-701]|nr:unnamed protein product [Pedinophyceae sp. YPF-701]
MSGLLQKATALAGQVAKAAEPVTSRVVSTYKSALASNQQYIVRDAAELSKVNKTFFYSNLARFDGMSGEINKEVDVLKKMWANRTEHSMAEAGVVGLFALETYGLYKVGEMVGRGSITGYHLP